jgi:hypothetical protein
MLRYGGYRATVWFGILLFVLSGCAPSFKPTGINPRFDFSSVRTIGTLVLPSGEDTLDQIYRNILRLDLSSRGFRVFDVNRWLEEQEVNPEPWREHKVALDSLVRRGLPGTVDLVAVSRVEWDDVEMYWDMHKVPFVGVYGRQAGFLTLESELALLKPRSGESALSVSRCDTMGLMKDRRTQEYFQDPPPWLAEKHVSRTLDGLPICSVDLTPEPLSTFPLVFYVDESYRRAFSADWREKLERRLVYVNDIYSNIFGIEFKLAGFQPWHSEFSSSLDTELDEVKQFARLSDSTFVAGVTLDPDLLRFWTDRNRLGLAHILSNFFVVTTHPSTLERGSWNAIEEALTMAHELGHLLGAVHYRDIRSIMNPESGDMSDQFDRWNMEIVRAMAPAFLRMNPIERARRHARVVMNSFQKDADPRVDVLGALLADCLILVPSSSDSIVVRQSVENTIDNPPLKLGCLGLLALSHGNLDSAASYFAGAIEKKPDLAEAYEYLSSTLYALGDSTGAIQNKARAIELGR